VNLRGLFSRGVLVSVQLVQERLEIGAGEVPTEGLSLRVEAALEAGDPLGQHLEVDQIVRGENLALQDGEDDLD